MCTCMDCNYDIQTTKERSVQFDFHFFFGFVLLAVRRSMACCLQSRAKKEIQSCIVFWRAQCASKACSDYRAQGRRIRNYRRWETTKTWWLLSGEFMDFSTYISLLCKKRLHEVPCESAAIPISFCSVRDGKEPLLTTAPFSVMHGWATLGCYIPPFFKFSSMVVNCLNSNL